MNWKDKRVEELESEKVMLQNHIFEIKKKNLLAQQEFEELEQ